MLTSTSGRHAARAVVLATIVCGGIWTHAQDPGHGYTAADIERGGQTYLLSCASCHGPNGDTLPGVSLFTGTYRRATSDQELAALFRAGIPGTPMPPSSLSEADALQVVAYLRSRPAAMAASRTSGPVGTAAAGKALYGTLECATCHMIDGTGGFLGPDLSSVGITRRADELERALTNPDADVRNGSRTVAVTTSNGAAVSGRLLNQDTYTLQFIDTTGRLMSIRKDGVRRWEIMNGSAMPDYSQKLNAQQIADLVSYLQALNAPVRSGGVAGTARGGGPPRGGGAGPAGAPAGGRGGRGGTP